MNVIVYRHKEYEKFIVTIENGCSVKTITLYDVSISELSVIINELTKEI